MSAKRDRKTKRLIYLCDTASDGESAGVIRPLALADLARRGGYRPLIVSSTVSNKSMVRSPAGIRRIGSVPFLRLEGLFVAAKGLRRALNMAVFFVRSTFLLWRLHRKPGIKVVVTSSTGLLDSFAGWMAKKFFGFSWLLEVRDIWPDAPKQLRPELRSYGFYALTGSALKTALNNADAILSPLKRLQAYAEQRGVPARVPFLHIPNCIYALNKKVCTSNEPSTNAPSSVWQAIEELRQQAKPIVAYFGSMNTANGVERLFDLFGRIPEHEASFLFVGDGPALPYLKTLAIGKKHVRVCDGVPQAACRALMGHVDILAFGVPPIPVYAYGLSPIKLSEYLHAGKPIFYWGAPIDGCDVPEDAPAIVSVDSSDPNIAARSLLNLVQESPETRRFRSECASRLGAKRFRYAAYERQLCTLLASITGQILQSEHEDSLPSTVMSYK